MLNTCRVRTTVVSPATAARDGFYRWVGAKNDCRFYGVIDGYHMGFCVEVKKPNGELGYSSVSFVSPYEELDILLPEDEDGNLCEWNNLGITASCCLHSGQELTGRIVFRGYYREDYDYEEREECFYDASKEVEALWDKWVV